MKTLFIFGNGFDINLGLKTDYQTYYDLLINKKEVQPTTKALQNEIFQNRENWADFEFALGEYTDKIKSESDFIGLYKDIITTLAEHLESEEKKLDNYTIDVTKIKSQINNPISIIPNEEGRIKAEISTFRGTFNVNSNINIITFNYTKSLEYIFGSRNNIILNGQRKIDAIHHIHGDLINRMILGVNDKTQIENKEFKENQNIVSRIIKNQVNQISGDLTFENCQSQISSSNLIILFGVSIGVTDKIWWEKIYNRLKSNKCKLLIFHYHNEPYDQRIPAEKLQIQEEVKKRIISDNKEKQETIELVRNNIYVIVNGPFLQNIYKKNNNE